MRTILGLRLVAVLVGLAAACCNSDRAKSAPEGPGSSTVGGAAKIPVQGVQPGNVELKPGKTSPPPGYVRKQPKSKPASGKLTLDEAVERVGECADKKKLPDKPECLSIRINSEEPEDGWYSFSCYVADKCLDPALVNDPNGFMAPVLGHFEVNETTGAVRQDDPTEENYVECLGPGRPKENPKIIDDIASWKHPTKAVFQKNGVEVHKLVLTNRQTYPTWEVTLPVFRDTLEDRTRIRDLYNSLCEKNAGFSYALDDRRTGVRTTVECAGAVAVGGEGLGW
jgi:hypothetical protein